MPLTATSRAAHLLILVNFIVFSFVLMVGYWEMRIGATAGSAMKNKSKKHAQLIGGERALNTLLGGGC
jgi:hypothetical protein